MGRSQTGFARLQHQIGRSQPALGPELRRSQPSVGRSQPTLGRSHPMSAGAANANMRADLRDLPRSRGSHVQALAASAPPRRQPTSPRSARRLRCDPQLTRGHRRRRPGRSARSLGGHLAVSLGVSSGPKAPGNTPSHPSSTSTRRAEQHPCGMWGGCRREHARSMLD